jgi:iron(III) transport system substrate-binding protein
LLWIFAPLLSVVAVTLPCWLGGFVPFARAEQPSVVLYCSQDQVFAEPLLKQFTQQSGIMVRPVFDSEAVKTVGLANRLLGEIRNPRADVWWSNEEFRTRQLAERGVFGTNRMGVRHRCLVRRSGELPAAGLPRALVELTNQAWRGRVSLAFPLFGTTSTHLLALRSQWGEQVWTEWCRALAANQPFLEEGNSHVVRRVARGEAWVGLTDSDDLAAARREGLPLEEIPLGNDGLRIPNTVALVRPATLESPARKLAAFLGSSAVQESLVAVSALDPQRPSSGATDLDWPRILREADQGTEELKGIFRR